MRRQRVAGLYGAFMFDLPRRRVGAGPASQRAVRDELVRIGLRIFAVEAYPFGAVIAVIRVDEVRVIFALGGSERGVVADYVWGRSSR